MSAEIEMLRARKETLKGELQTEGQREKSLQEDIDILKEKIEIRGLEKELETRHESVKQLESRKSELQGEWSQSTQETRKNGEPKAEPSTEPTIMVMPTENHQPVGSEKSGAQKKKLWF